MGQNASHINVRPLSPRTADKPVIWGYERRCFGHLFVDFGCSYQVLTPFGTLVVWKDRPGHVRSYKGGSLSSTANLPLAR